MSDTIELRNAAERVEAGADLTPAEAEAAARALAAHDVEAGLKERFLIGFANKGETGAEVGCFARTFRVLARDPGVGEWAGRAIDVCGTGGDRQGTFNISTTAALVLAAAGVPVFKHGNRSITSSCGSADLLQALGVPLEMDEDLARRSLDKLNFVFFFAPAYHPAFKEIMPVRKALAGRGQRTVFNILGPLINPGRPAFQLMGVFGDSWVSPLAEALHSVGLEAGYVAHGRLPDGEGMDEISCATQNRTSGFGRFQGDDQVWGPDRYGLPECQRSDLAGGSLKDNLRVLQAIFDGEAPAGLVNSILLNAALAFSIQGRAASVEEGLELARENLLGGAVRDFVKKVGSFYQ
jgi:anthranilate phosphoribosyltransferase